MPEVEEEAPTYSANHASSYAVGYQTALHGMKSASHDARLLSKTEYDKGYAKGWKEYSESKLIRVLEGKQNERNQGW